MIDLALSGKRFDLKNEHRSLQIWFRGNEPVALLFESLPANGLYVAHALKEGVRYMPANYAFQIQSSADFAEKLRYAIKVLVANG